MQWYLEKLTEFCNGMNLPPQYTQIAVSLILAVGFILVLFCLQRVLRFVLVAGTHLWSKRSRNTWDDAFCEAKFPGRIAHLLIAILSLHGYAIVFAQNPGFAEVFKAGTSIYFAVAVAGTAYALVDAIMIIGTNNERLKDVPIKGFFQAIKIILTLGVAIWVLSILSDKSPAYFLSGLGALMAILLIVFKDTLLGFTAGILISANDLVRNKDWIEIPGTNVDGEVFDVSLTTVKVRNWDNTIANVPAYTLISGAFKNWRGMEKSGGRRIKRAISIDMQTIHFASEQEIARWQKIELLKPYLSQKLEEIREANARVPETADPSVPANTRNLTNIGTFRAYCVAYLKANRKIHQGMTMLVRQLDPKATGLPLEIYVFTNDTRWGVYENIQSDIFDHLFAIMPEFGLAPFQEPSGRNFS
ncbi:MAG: mechanosensitive ion channel family protein [Opitutales bacterium]|nr:mechanosensitive ion channel family protein [Opitutales bacterium]